MSYKIVRVRDKYFILIRALVKTRGLFSSKEENKWVRVGPDGKAFTENPEELKHEGFHSMDEAYAQISVWST